MKPKITTILVLMLLPMIGQAQRQQYQQVNDILYTASSDAYARSAASLTCIIRQTYRTLPS
jgi:hypothetical protein